MKMRDDPLWDDLRYWLANPITEEEEREREKEEKAYRENLLAKMFGEPPNGTVTGGAAPIQTQYNWDKHGNIYQSDTNGNKLQSSPNYLEKFSNTARALGANIANFVNETNPEHQSYKQKANLAAAATTLPYASETLLTKAVASKLAPYTGRKMAQGIAEGISSGSIGGAVEGALKSYQEKKNPMVTIAQDSVMGALGGVLGGSLSGYSCKIANQNAMSKFNAKIKQSGNQIKGLTPDERSEYFKLGKNYFKDYEQGVNTIADKIGNVKLASDAIEETNIQSPHLTKNVVNLSKSIQKSKIYRKRIRKSCS